jgi:signal transduction histidine kinase
MPRDDQPVRADDSAGRLGELIDQHRATIEQRWLDRILADLGSNPGAELTELRDGMPDYLASVVALLGARPAINLLERAHTAWSDMARQHGVTRVRIGFDIGQLVHEFVVLRHVIRELATESGINETGVEALLADILDAAISEAVEAYVEARDYEARRKQAENIGFLTHELRNPLSTAVLSTTALRRCALPDCERQLGALERAHKRLVHMVDSVLLNEKLEVENPEIHPVEMSMGELLEPALEAARQNADIKRVDFRVHYDPTLRVSLDPTLTRSAVENVVDNAVKYTDAGHVDVMLDEQPDALVLHVRDTCHGISPEELRTIFEPFQRGRTHKQGTGLGLAIARRAVEAQGGSIAAESPEARGCHFSIRLPRHAPPP